MVPPPPWYLHLHGFAFVLYSADDEGGLVGGETRPRARQNVIFEHGLLAGKLGRDRVCALVMDEVEIPSDLDGVVYQGISNPEREAIVIARILQDVGYRLDVAKLV